MTQEFQLTDPCPCKYPSAQDLLSWEMTMGELARFQEVRRYQLPPGILAAQRIAAELAAPKENSFTYLNELSGERITPSPTQTAIILAMPDLGLHPDDPFFTHNLAQRAKRIATQRLMATPLLEGTEPLDPDLVKLMTGEPNPEMLKRSPIMVVSTPNNSDIIHRMMQDVNKHPFVFVQHGHPDLPAVQFNGEGFVPPPPIWEGIAPIEIDPAQGSDWSWEIPKDLTFATEMVNNPDFELNKAILQKAADTIGISPELLQSTHDAEGGQVYGSIRDHIENWKVQFAKAAQPIIGRGVKEFAKNILLKQMKTVKAKTHHHNGGSMRQRRARHYFGRVDKSVLAKTLLLQNAYPVSMGPSTPTPDGNCSVDVTFQFDGGSTVLPFTKFDPPSINIDLSHEIAMRAHQAPDGKLDLVSFDIVNRAQ